LYGIEVAWEKPIREGTHWPQPTPASPYDHILLLLMVIVRLLLLMVMMILPQVNNMGWMLRQL